MNGRLEPVVAVIMLGVLAMACADKSVVAPSAAALPTAPFGGVGVLLTCDVTVASATMTCAPATVAAPSGMRARRGGINRDYVTVGGPGTYVDLISSGTAASSGVLTSNVLVWNLLAQPMNTPDGMTADTGGVKVFFSSGPTVTSGTGPGTVTVTPNDGTGTFTASDQPFYEYSNGAILPSGGKTAAKTWTFAYTSGVQTFTFDCYVYTRTPGTGIVGSTATPLVFYVVNNGTPSVTVFGAAASGDASPIGTIAGSSTLLDRPNGVALNDSGVIYVTNDSNNINASNITVYLHGFTGDPMPVDTIIGNHTGLAQPAGIAIDGSDHIYVTNDIGASVTVYPPGADGNVAFTAKIQGSNTHLADPQGIALDGAGNIYVAGGDDTVTVYSGTGLSGTVNLTPLRTIAGSNTHLSSPFGIAVDGAGNIYVSNAASFTVTIYAGGATGASGNVAPTDSIAGSNTGLSYPEGLALDPAGNIYVTNAIINTITIYAVGMFGNVAPVSTITGTFTGLNGPLGVAF